MANKRWLVGLVLVVGACSDEKLDALCKDPAGCEPQQEGRCGDGVVDADERCDIGIDAGPGACPTSCTPVHACLPRTVVGEGCQAHCETVEITTPQDGDGCCPTGASSTNDNDCADSASCGNGALDPGEACDTGITSGAGACPTSCTSATACASGTLLGSACNAQCVFAPVAPTSGDGCCASLSDAPNDEDCASFLDCTSPPRTFDAEEAWAWGDAPLLLRTSGSTMTTPLVAQFTDDNGDGVVDANDIPDVLSLISGTDSITGIGGSQALPSLFVLFSGDTGAVHWTFNGTPWAVAPMATPAVADLDGDGLMEIVTITAAGPSGGDGLVAFDVPKSGAPTHKWTSTPFTQKTVNDMIGAVSIADLDGDGRPEIIAGNRVFDHHGQARWQGPEITGDLAIGRISVAANLAPSPGLEVLDGPTLYTATGQRLFTYGDGSYSFSTVGDCDGDGTPEILLHGAVSLGTPTVVLLNADGTVRAGPVAPNGLTPNTPGAAGDLDGDGKAEFVVGATAQLIALDCELDVVMSSTILDLSGATGPVLFDFDGDGALEIVHIDEAMVRVIAGDGTPLWSTARLSLTGMETAAIADVDKDGEAEIIVPQGRVATGVPVAQGVKVYRSAGAPWSGTRSIYNQHAYRVSNVFDDGAVPLAEGPFWSTFGLFRGNLAVPPPDSACWE